MIKIFFFLLVLATLSACSTDSDPLRNQKKNKVGYTAINFVDNQRNRPLNLEIWYPAADDTQPQHIAYQHFFSGHATLDAAYTTDTKTRPLILLSHGDRGNNFNLSWLAELLASNGYIVAAVDHWLNTTEHNTPEGTVAMWQRPADISYVLTQLLADPIWKQRIDSERIGVAGHSSGGYTAIAMAGAVFDHRLLEKYCLSPLRGVDCELTKDANYQSIDFSAETLSYRDDRIKAAFSMAPAVGQGIAPASLSDIAIPVHIVATQDDEILKPNLNAEHYATYIPHAQLALLPAGGHFAFLSECTRSGKWLAVFIEFDVCGLKTSTERAVIHKEVGRQALLFFEKSLNPSDRKAQIN